MADSNTPSGSDELSENEFSEMMGLEDEAPQAVKLIDDTSSRIQDLVAIPENISSAADVQLIIDSLQRPDSFSGTIITTDKAGKKSERTELITNREGDLKALGRLKQIFGWNLEGLEAQRKSIPGEVIDSEQNGDLTGAEQKKKLRLHVINLKKAYGPDQEKLFEEAGILVNGLVEKTDYRRDFLEIDNEIDELAMKAMQIKISASEDVDRISGRFELSEQDNNYVTLVKNKLRDGESLGELKPQATKLAAIILTKLIANPEKDETFYKSIKEELIPLLEVEALNAEKNVDLNAVAEALKKTTEMAVPTIDESELSSEEAQAAKDKFNPSDFADEAGSALDDMFGEE